MDLSLLDSVALEAWIRAGVFGACVTALWVAETVAPRRTVLRSLERLSANIGLLVINTTLIRLISAASLVGAAAVVSSNGWGLFNMLAVPTWLEVPLAVVLLDFGMYVQHRAFHRFAWLWRWHAVHHSDIEFDVSTGVRFHPGEILVSFGYKLALVVVLGASVWAVLAFEVLLSSASLFTHANVALPPRIDAWLRRAIVTPDVHRIHHSTDDVEHNRNFGFLLICWDRWLRTYRADPRSPHATMPIGLNQFRNAKQQELLPLLKQPFGT